MKTAQSYPYKATYAFPAFSQPRTRNNMEKCKIQFTILKYISSKDGHLLDKVLALLLNKETYDSFQSKPRVKSRVKETGGGDDAGNERPEFRVILALTWHAHSCTYAYEHTNIFTIPSVSLEIFHGVDDARKCHESFFSLPP